MIRRCYDKDMLVKNPTYRGISVCDEWMIASNFKEWMKSQIWQGLELDKDILIQGNTVYGPSSCAFVPKRINTLLLFKREVGEFPVGVSLRSGSYNSTKKFCSRNEKFPSGKTVKYHLNYIEAHKCWQIEKAKNIEKAINWYSTLSCFRTDVAESLMSRVWKLRNDAVTGEETKFI